MFNKLLNLVFPYSCLICCQQKVLLCAKCKTKVTATLTNRYDLLPLQPKKRGSVTVPVYSCGLYDFESGWVKIIKRYKYRFSQELHAFLADQLYSILYSHHLALLKRPEQVILIPVPLAYLRYNWRGFNQSQLLAHKLSTLTGIAVWQGVKRIKDTGSQAYLGAQKRRSNLSNAFKLTAKLPDNIKTVILVDDVLTTGSTMRTIINVLRDSYPNQKYLGICLASRLVF